MFDSSDEEEVNVAPDNYVPIEISWLTIEGSGNDSKVLGLTSLPGCKFKQIRNNLKMDLDHFENENVSDIIVLLTRGEFQKYRVPNLLNKYESRGFSFHHFSIMDGSVPSIDSLMSILLCIRRLLEADKKVLIHCLGGLGRTCCITSCLLQYLDESVTAEATVNLLRSLRGPQAIQTLRQYNMIHDFRDLYHIWLNEDTDECISR